MPPFSRPALALLLAASLLAGCESGEEKAERFYQSALQLLDRGDTDRALVELRNVFDNDGLHKEARELYASLQLERGEVEEAYSQLLLLVEQYPDEVEGRLDLAEIAIGRGDWEEAKRHGDEAARLAPDEPRVRAVGLALRYRDAVLARDADAREEAGREARILLAQEPGLSVARRVVIDLLSTGPNPADALPELDKALEAEPDSLEFQVAKYRILARSGDAQATGAQLREMYERFPDNAEVRAALVGWYVSQGDEAGAETLLRELAGPDEGEPGGHLAVVQFLRDSQGPEAAVAELDRLAAANGGAPNADLYRATRAGLDFEAGRRDEAIAALEGILAEAEPSDQTRRIKTGLARMLSETGNDVGARARVEEVLAEDATNVEALKLRAAWATRDDRPGDAVQDLRTALSQDPRDVETLTLMAEAHLRDGSPELAGERLALAVEVSDAAPEPALRYARFLQDQDSADAAETVLLDARAAHGGDPRIHAALGEAWLRAGELARVEESVTALQAIDTPEARQAADQLNAAALLARGQTDEGLGLLQATAAEGGDAAAVARVLETLLRSDRGAEARDYLDGEIAKRPEDLALRLMDASLRATTGDPEGAKVGYRALIAETPAAEAPVRLLYALLAAQGEREEATAVLDAGLAAQPASRRLRWFKAGELERDGDIDGAIAVYEALYAENTSDVVVANNLASLLAVHRASDAEGLSRAAAIARRLRGSEQPAFQDTYGWIAFRQGELDEALSHLEPAAEGLPQDPLVQLHLGLTYQALGRTEDAIRQIERALAVAGGSSLPQFEEARATLAALRAGEAGPAPGEAPQAEVDPSADPEADPAMGPAASPEAGPPAPAP